MDKDIFEQLYRQHYAAALLYAQGLCRGRPLAEDMVQEAFCRAWLALPDGVETGVYALAGQITQEILKQVTMPTVKTGGK